MTRTASPRSPRPARRVITPHPERHVLRPCTGGPSHSAWRRSVIGERLSGGYNRVWKGLVWAFVIEFAVVALVVTIKDDWWIALALLIVGVLEWSNIVHLVTR